MKPVHRKPEQVLVTGEPGILEKLKELGGGEIVVATEEVSVEGRRENFPQTARLMLPEGIKLLREEDSLVELIVEVKERVESKTVAGVELSLPTFLEGVVTETSPTQVRVKVEAPVSLLEKIDRSSFVFNTKQPLNEVPGSVGSFAIEAKFSDSVEREVRERGSVIGLEPDTVEIRFMSKVEAGEKQ
jgi:hypothetical protein